jgi:4-amino-4-deoxy-L-arabinose transferase-like glycosyltransferase
MLHPPPRTRLDTGLLAVLLVALALRVWRVDVPYIDAHSWRQVTNADIARHFATSTVDIFHPQVSWGGRDGVVGMEFPLLQWTTGLVWRVTGESAVVGRLMAILWSVLGVAALYGLGRRLLGRAGGLAAATLMAVSPGVVYFGRSFLSDTPMLTLMIAAVWAWEVFFERPTRAIFVMATALTALAALVKLPAILVLAPIAGVALRHRGWGAALDLRLWAAVVAAGAATAAWYLHADRLFLETGLTQAVFRPSGTYPPDLAPGVTFVSVSHWATAARLWAADTWSQLGDRFWQLHLTPFGATGALVGIWIAPWRARLPIDLWALAGALLLVVALEGQYWHEFHQLPLLPPLFLYFGAAAAPLFEPAWRQRLLPGVRGAAVLAGVGAVVVVQLLRASGAVLHLYRPDNLQAMFLQVGAAVRAATAPDAPVITVDYDAGGANSPMLLYFAHRQGWSFDVASISDAVVERLRARHGAAYFATAVWDELARAHPALASFLTGRCKEVELQDVPAGVRLFDLRAAR